MNSSPTVPIETIRWNGDHLGWLRLLDQTSLPHELRYLECRDVETIWDAIRSLRVRGAPAIGISAAYALVIAVQSSSRDQLMHDFGAAVDRLRQSRPTAVNLFWALDRMQRRFSAEASTSDVNEIQIALLDEARAIQVEDRRMCHAIGRHGVELLPDGANVLTHCNAGGLATAEYGTALSIFFTAQDHGKSLHVYVDETRPLLQGSRLTAWELAQRGIRATLICDSMAARVMFEGRVQAVFTGADRIAANGDTANKIGTYSLAVLAHAHAIPFYVAAPSSTFDLSLTSGDEIEIEQRNREEITHWMGQPVAATGIDVYNPAFDITPHKLISAIVTERGIIRPVNRQTIATHFHDVSFD